MKKITFFLSLLFLVFFLNPSFSQTTHTFDANVGSFQAFGALPQSSADGSSPFTFSASGTGNGSMSNFGGEITFATTSISAGDYVMSVTRTDAGDFDLESLTIENSFGYSAATVTITGRFNGANVTGATASQSMPADFATVFFDLSSDSDFNNIDEFRVTFTGTVGTSFGFRDITIDAASVANSAPTATAPSSPSVNEDATNVALSDNIQVTDSDGDSQTVAFTVTGGIVTLGTSGITFPVGTNGSSSFSATGTLAAINTALDAATFTPTPDLNGTNAGTISFTTNDGTAPTSAAASVTFNITAVNDDPTLTGLPSSITVTEDTASNVDLSAATFADVDATSVVMTITAAAGTLSAISGGSVTIGGSGTSAITLTGSPSNIETYLNTTSNIKYTSALNATTATSLAIKANDGGSSGSGGGVDVNFSSVTVNIDGQNDAPTLTGLPGSVTLAQNTASNVDLSAATFADVDATSVVMTITAAAGTLSAISGGSVTIGGSGTSAITLTGSPSNIDTYLNTVANIKYTSALNATTATSLAIKANDGGSSGSGGGVDVNFSSVTVNIVSFTALSDLCIDAGVQTGLGGGSPSGGVYSGPGVTDDGNGTTYSFNPATAGVGTHTITYTLSGIAATDNVEVFALPTVTFTALADLTTTDGVQTGLGGGSPSGGVYSGTGVTDDGNGSTYSFDPAGSGVGTHTLTYSFTNTNSCSSSASDDVVVTAGDATAPSFENSTPSTSNLDDLYFALNVDLDEAGTAYYVIVADLAAAPSSAQVKAGQNATGSSALFSGNKALTTAAGFLDVAVLTPATSYDVYVVAEDGSANLSASPTKIDVTTPAASANFRWTSATGTGTVTETVNGITATITTSGADASISNINGFASTIYNTVGSTGAVTSTTVSFNSPVNLTSIHLVNFTGNTWVLTPTGGSNSVVNNSVTGGTVANLNWIGVTSFAITKDGVGTEQFIFDEIVVNTADLIAPTFDSTPSSASISDTGFTLNTDINEAGTIYYVVVANGATAPSSAEVKAGTGNGGSGEVTSGNAAVSTGGFTNAFSVTGLTGGTDYDVYVVAEDDEGTPNLQANPTKIDVTTIKSNQTITFGTLTGKTFGDAAFALTGTASSSLTVSYASSNTSVATVSGTTVTIVGAGSTNITASQTGDTNYNAAIDVVQGLTVNTIPPTITFTDIGKTYGDSDFALGATSNSSGTISYSIIAGGTGSASLSGTNNATVTLGNAGTVIIRATQGSAGNYAASTKDATITIGKAILTATADDKTRAYGDANPAFTITYSGFKNGDDASALDTAPTASSTANLTTGVGSATITTSVGADENYTISTVNGTLTVTKRSITVSSDTGQAKVIGSADPVSYSYAVTVGSVVNGDTPTGALTRTAGELPGQYPITLGTLSYGINYNVTYVGRDFFISFVLTTGIKVRSSLSATITGESTSQSGIVERGVVYSSVDTDPEVGEANVIKVVDDTTTGPFEVTIKGLTPNRTYYFQTYVISNTSRGGKIAPEFYYGGVQNFATALAEPTATAYSPTDGSFLVDPTTNLTITFDQNVQKGTGNIEIRKTSDDSVVESIDVTGAAVTISGAVVTINPTADLPQLTDLYVLIDIGAIENLSGDNWSGTSTPTEWTFQSDDTQTSIVTGTTPTDDAIDVPPGDNLTVTFDENVIKGTGNILVKNLSDDSIIATLDITSSEVSITNNVVTIDPATDLPSETDIYIEVASGVFEDQYDNVYPGISGNTAWNFTTADITSPTVVVSTTSGSPINTPFTATFTFSEAVTNFDLTDIIVTNGTAGTFNLLNPVTYTALITPTTDGEVTVSIAAGVLQDASNSANNNLASNVLSMTYDITKPTLLITTDATDPTNLTSFTATFTFSEDMASFEDTDLTIVNATISNFVTVNDALYTATITPIADGLVTIDLPLDTVEDNANNGNVAATQYSITYDVTSPTVTISATVADPINVPFTVTFRFNEDVTGFELSDITLANGTASAFATVSATEYTALITPMADGQVTIDVNASVTQDLATNPNIAATQFTIDYDGTNPMVVITTDAIDPTNTEFTATFTFDEDVTGFDLSDITLANGTASAFNATSATVYTATITPTTDGNVTIDVAADVAQDTATNGNAAATQYSVLYDITDPTLAITSNAANPVNVPFTSIFTFSEDVTGFELSDITVSNGTASAFARTSATVYTALITPTSDGEVTVDVYQGVALDLATNENEASAQFTIDYDGTSPTLVITTDAAMDPTNEVFTATFTFDEDVTGFEVGDITLVNGTASAFATISASEYTALITPTTDGDVTIDVAANVSQDTAANGNDAAIQYSILYDATNPTVAITSNAPDPVNGPFDITMTFSEAVTGFDIADLTITNGTASAFVATSASVYTATITPTVDADITIEIATNASQDAATNGNDAAQFIIEYDSTPPVKPQITHISDYTCVGNVTMTGDNTLEISGTAERGSTIEVFIDGVSIGTTMAGSNNGFFTLDHTGTTLADGTYSITTTATDVANNTSALSDALSITINSLDTDGDGLPDFCDDDDDGNGVDDVDEDCDGDGIVDHLDTDNSSCSNTITETKTYGFSPNGDGINEGWVIENIRAYPNSLVQVFNRSGKLVFKKKGYQNDWEGISNQISSSGLGARLPVGPYLFIIDLGNGSKPTRGWLYINY